MDRLFLFSGVLLAPYHNSNEQAESWHYAPFRTFEPPCNSCYFGVVTATEPEGGKEAKHGRKPCGRDSGVRLWCPRHGPLIAQRGGLGPLEGDGPLHRGGRVLPTDGGRGPRGADRGCTRRLV